MSCRFSDRLWSQRRSLRIERIIARLFASSTEPCLSACSRKPFTVVNQLAYLRLFATARSIAAGPESVNHNVTHAAEQELSNLQDRVNKIIGNAITTPTQEAAQLELQRCENFARSIAAAADTPRRPQKYSTSPTSTLLSLEKQQENVSLVRTNERLALLVREKLARRVSGIAYSIVTDPKIFITPVMLATYVSTQSLLSFPESIPQIFVLYASKPIPVLSQSQTRFKAPNLNKISSAISFAIANIALDAAILSKDLPLCLDIINTSVCTTTFRRSKIFRRALLPCSVFALVPPAAYTLASQFALYQDTMDPATATNLAFAGILAYVGFTATIGIVAVTTANDQMDRVTWVTGTPLRERWLREEERALVDRVAGAWGFQDKSKRGEEEGKDWETLREWVGLRGMVLDRVELMEGME